MKTRIITAAVGLGVLAVVLAFFDTFLFDLVLSAVCLRFFPLWALAKSSGISMPPLCR